ncbi:hypothetical protein ACIBF6_43800 [Streptosporangium amethystogenes]|uniref:hypothetical protein n=1 Tax=Streptosporangium amethystogenes TaxID=2002 RepID=UPI003789B95E
MIVERALVNLRRELLVLGVVTEDRDVFWARSGDPMLSLAPGPVVWTGPEWFRWIGEELRWRCHTVHDPAGAARQIHRACNPPEGLVGGNLTAPL